MSNLEFPGVFTENTGVLETGTLRLTDSSLIFKNDKGGKSINVSGSDIDDIKWQKLGNKPGLRVALSDGGAHRFGGFKDSDLEKVSKFTESNWSKPVSQSDLVIKGWNYGNAAVKGKSIEFSWEDKPIFEIPCTNVSNCTANKNEAVLEFHINDKSQIALTEMRFHMPVDAEDADEEDPVDQFKKAVLAYAGLEVETEQPITLLSDVLCTTPRGRYDIKVYPTSIALHGKTYDYKITTKSINRLFLVPHRDGRHVYFVLSLNPPIRQGQTRYSYLVFEFIKDDERDFEIALTNDQIRDQYNGQLETTMTGPIYETVSRLFKAVCNLKITVPGKFVGATGTPAIQCSHKQNPGLLYPMEKGFLFIHKPPMYVRFEEISSCHFARSDGGSVTRTIDFEIDLKAGSSLMFNSIEKEENNKLYDYLNKKNIKIRNAQRIAQSGADLDSSDDDHDPYKAALTAEGRQRDMSESESDDEDYDLDKDLKKKKKEKDSSEGSGSEPDDEYDSGSEQDSSGTGESEPDDEEDVQRKKKKSGEPKEKRVRKDKEEKKGGKKGKKDPNEPKRALSAYMIWFQSVRVSLKEDGDTVADVARKAGAKWKEMSSADKKEWEEKAAEDKVRYEAEKKEFKKNGGSAAASSSSKASKKTSGPSPSKAKSKEYISDSDDSDEDETPKKKDKKTAPKDEDSDEEDEDSDAGSDASNDSD